MSGPAPAGSPRPLRQRLTRAVVAATALIVLVGVVATAALVQTSRRTEALVDRISPARIAATELRAAYLEQQAGVSDFVLSRREEALESYRRGRTHEQNAVRQLDTLLGDRPALRADLAEVGRHADLWRTRYAEPAIAGVRAGAPAPSPDAGRPLSERLRLAVTTLVDDLSTARAGARDDLIGAIRLLYLVTLGALLGVVLAGFALWRAQQTWVLDPIEAVAADVRRVAAGEVAHPVQEVGPAGIAALARDIEAMRSSLVAVLASALTAQRALQDQTEQLEAQTADLHRSNAELEQFAYVASHDLQEPLRKVASFCQMLQSRYAGQLDDRADQYIEFAVDGAKRMQQLINDLLTFSRVGRTTGGFTSVDLRDALDRALNSLSTAVEESGATVDAPWLPTVHGNPTLLTQTFQNLIGNAVKFRGAEPPRVTVGVERAGDEWHFSCADNGLGIEPQYAERVFVIFQRLHPKDEYPGTGIGLALCRKIIEHHGGRIWLDTDRTDGATVRWTLPVTDESRHRPAERPLPPT